MVTALVVAAGLSAMKFGAYLLTGSHGVLADALESLVNLGTSLLTLISIRIAAQPRDRDHPYGHGKAELLAAGFQGGFICFAGLFVVAQGLYGLWVPRTLARLDVGIVVTLAAGMIGAALGMWLKHKGRASGSRAIEADGMHYLSDSITSAGLVLGLIVIYFTELVWLDSLMAIVFGVLILAMGARLVRASGAALMDEADHRLLERIAGVLSRNRAPEWIDVHNLRVLQYGRDVHIDCHMTLPWYETLRESHDRVKTIEELIRRELGPRTELFIHADPCRTDSCASCSVAPCPHRAERHRGTIEWNVDHLVSIVRHRWGEEPKFEHPAPRSAQR